MLFNNIAISCIILFLKALTWLYWRVNVQPEFDAKGCDSVEYNRRRSSGQFFSFGILALILVYIAYLIAFPQPEKSVENPIALFFLCTVSFCLNLLGAGSGLRYLKEKNVRVTPFGKLVLVFDDAVYVIGMVVLYYLSTLQSLLR
jgi:hypothetical protein